MTGSSQQVVVVRYGVPSRWDPPPEVDQQLRLAHELREHLVRLEHERGQATAAVWSAHPKIADVEAEITDLEQRLAEAGTQAAAERSAARRRGPTPASETHTALKAARRDAKARRRELIARARAESQADLDVIAGEHKAAVKATYAAWCQRGDGGPRLFHGTYYTVLRQHQTAAARVSKARAAGQRADLRHHRWDGSGMLAVILLRQAGQPPRDPATIADGQAGKWRNQFWLTPWIEPDRWDRMSRGERRRVGRGQARMSLGWGAGFTVPVQVHRMLPADADITGVQLVVRRRGGHRRVEVHVTAKVPAPEPATQRPVIALHLGWRHDTDEPGAALVRVATWRASEPVTVPRPLTERTATGPAVMTQTSPSTGTVVLPPDLGPRTHAHDQQRARRDRDLELIRARLATWLDVHGPVQAGGREVGAGDVRRWRSPARVARLALVWRESPPDGGDGVAAELEAWRARDRRAWEPEAHGRAGVVDARDNAYRRAAAWLASVAGELVLDDTSVAAVARRADPAADPQIPTAAEDAAAHSRTLAAPGRLRELARNATRQRGTPVTVVSHTGLTRTHARCGHTNPADSRYATSRVVTCDGCGQSYDQDASATMLMLAKAPAARTSPGSVRHPG